MVELGADHAPQGRILIADDEESFLQSVAVLLRREGFECACAPDGAEAERLLGERRFDLLISDIRMPGNQELDLVRRVPAFNAGIPVILVTGYPSMPTALQALSLPVIAYLVKPTDFGELLSHVRRGVALRRVSATLSDSTRRLEAWVEGMNELRLAFESRPLAALQSTWEGALALSLGNMAGALLDLQSLFKMATGLAGPPADCGPSSCPRLKGYQDLLSEAVEVLEETKNSFHSRQLRDLRLRLVAARDAADKPPEP